MPPSWAEESDPWLTTRMRQATRIAKHERAAIEAVAGAMSEFLTLARDQVLGQRRAVTADAGAPPNLDGWPDNEQWAAILREQLGDALTASFGEAFAAAAAGAAVSDARYRAQYMDLVDDRLSRNLWPDGVFEECRFELAEGLAQGESHDQLVDRLGGVLDIDAYSRRVRARINEAKREGRTIPASWWDRLGDEDRAWQWMARRIARTEIVGAANGGTYLAGKAVAEELGERRFKRWLATTDSRVRDSHWIAHGQVRPYEEPFDVGGFDLDYPHDPTAPAREVVHCRCTLQILSEDEVTEAEDWYQRMLPGRTDIEGNPLVADAEPVAEQEIPAEPEGEVKPPVVAEWRGVLAPFDTRGVSRVIGAPEGEEISTREMPLPLNYQPVEAPGHDGSFIVGRVDRVWREGEALMGEGRFDLEDPAAWDVARKVADGFHRWVSVDMEGEEEIRYYDPEGSEIDPSSLPSDPDELDALFARGEDGSAKITALGYLTHWRFAGVTLVGFPEFHTAAIQLASSPVDHGDVDSEESEEEISGGNSALAAAASPAAPVSRPLRVYAPAGESGEPKPHSWCERIAASVPMEPDSAMFRNPQLSGLTSVRISDDGWVYGHIADWNSRHAVWDVSPPKCPYGGTYPKFHRHAVRTSDGKRVLTGPLATGGHAEDETPVTMSAAMAHYDDPSYAVADVICGEDNFGIWVSGTLRYGVSPFQVMLLDRYSLSGDWRDNALIAACSVSVPAFHVAHDDEVIALAASAAQSYRLATPRPKMRREDGQVTVLTASGIVRPHHPPRRAPEIDRHQGYRDFRALRAAEREHHAVEAMRRHVHAPGAAALAHRVHQSAQEG